MLRKLLVQLDGTPLDRLRLDEARLAGIADAISRLPGLTAQRERGRATQINIRGFAGDFAGTTLNGREQVSLGDNRGVEFDQYPSELLSGVTIYKTPDASLVGQGLSGIRMRAQSRTRRGEAG